MISKEITIINKLGLHARAATKLVQLAQEFESAEIRLSANDMEADAKSIMEVLMLAAAKGTVLEIEIEGEETQENLILKRIESLILNRFDENE